jgi:hypothetical protein
LFPLRKTKRAGETRGKKQQTNKQTDKTKKKRIRNETWISSKQKGEMREEKRKNV